MKKLLLSIVSAFLLFTLSAQVTENFQDYTVGGKLAQQAQAMGRMYWTTWSNAPGGGEDGVIGEQSGSKVFAPTYGVDQVLKLGQKTSGVWELSLKLFVPTGKDAYFNVIAHFVGNGNDDVWAMQFAWATDVSSSPVYTPGVLKLYAGQQTPLPFNFTHDTWLNVKIVMDLDADHADFYLNNTLLHSWQYSLGTFGEGCPRVIDVMDIFPSSNTNLSVFYMDDIVFAPTASVLFQTGFDDKPNNSYVAQSYPDWWTTWDNHPGTTEDALITNAQSLSAPQSAKCDDGTDLVFKAGNKTSGAYTVDFDMYIPNAVPAYFNVLHTFSGSNSEWALGVYFNIPTSGGPQGVPAGTNFHQNGIFTPFTVPSNQWFHIHIDVDLDQDQAKISINNTDLTWQFSLVENGGNGVRQLAALDFFPIVATSVFYIDNFVYGMLGGGETFPIMNVTPTAINETLPLNGSVTKTITVANTGTSIGNYDSFAVFDFETPTGNSTFTLTRSTLTPYGNGGLGFSNLTAPTLVELAQKFTAQQLCDKLGTKITKLSYYLPSGQTSQGVNSLKFRVYGPKSNNTPGEVLAEATLNNPAEDSWSEVTLSNPVLINKSEYWISVEFLHQPNTYPMGIDAGPLVQNANYYRRDNGTWSVFANTTYGNYLIQGTTQGGVFPCWLSLTGDTYGTILAGNTKTFNAVLKAPATAGTYKATLLVSTNDTDHPLYEIPCTLLVGTAYTVEFIINDCETTNPITGATLVFNGQTITGTVVNNVFPGEYEYSISKDGYEMKSGKVTVVAENVIENVCLIPLGINDIKLYYNIYPNPATNNITIQRTASTLATIDIYNTMGMHIATYQTDEMKYDISLANLAAGTYFIRVAEGNLSAVKSFIKN